MLDDLKAASRSLRSSPMFTTVALLVLTLGIGATTAIFSVVDVGVLRGLPFDEHDRLVAIGERRPPRPDSPVTTPNPDPAAVSSSAPQNYMDWAAEQQVFESIAAISAGAFTLREPGAEPEELSSAAQSFMFRMDVTDPRAFAAAIGVLALAGLVASSIPARRAATVDPVIALRAE